MTVPDRSEGYAPGKLILAGEHAVVYGHPAVAAAVSRGTTVRLARRPGPSGLDGAPRRDERLDRALREVLPSEGIGVSIESELPIGRGMGSSASLAVALVRALARLEGEEADAARCVAEGFRVERVFHGTPSGVDHTVIALGGVVRFRRPPAGAVEIDPIRPCPSLPLVVLDSGEAGDTGRMVASVRARRPAVDGTLSRIGALAADFGEALASGASPAVLGPCLLENHALLAELGVSTPALDALVALALSAGAEGAKLAGAGGGGVVVALATDRDRLFGVAARAGARAFPVEVVIPERREP